MVLSGWQKLCSRQRWKKVAPVSRVVQAHDPLPPSPRPAALIDIPDVRFSVVPQPLFW